MRMKDRSGAPRARSWAAPRRVVLSALAAGVLAAQPAASGVQGCPCPSLTTERAVAQASLILVGKILSSTSEQTGGVVKQQGQWRSAPDAVAVTHVTMQVDAAAKGTVQKFAAISTPDLCGTPFVVGETYLVFATRNGSGLWTDACRGNASGTAVVGKLAEVRRLLTKPKPKP